jgi:hypothetical protein
MNVDAKSEPCARRTIFVGFRRAAIDLWGNDGLRRIGDSMSDEARRRCLDGPVIEEEMLPERFVLEWYECVWMGPAARDREAYNRFLDRMMDHGFGRVRKFLLGMATPTIVGRKSGELWRHDHTHGELTPRVISEHVFEMRLTDHPYVETPLARTSIAEIYRYAMSLARASNVQAKHTLLDERTLSVMIEWT